MVVSVSIDMTKQPASSSVVIRGNHLMTIIHSENECGILVHIWDNELLCHKAVTKHLLPITHKQHTCLMAVKQMC